MRNLEGSIVDLPKVSASIPTQKSVSGEVGAKTINIGEDGATFIPSVSSDGVISWTNDKGLTNPTPVNIKGAKGDKGDTGAKGDKGDQGIQGIQGEKGDKGEQGIPGKDGKDGENGKDGYTPIKGVDYFDGEKGDKGDKGDTYELTESDKQEIADMVDVSGGKAIIDVVELPTENIDEDSFYRLLTGGLVINQEIRTNWPCYGVESLPVVGEPAIKGNLSDTTTLIVTTYFLTNTFDLFGYVNTELSGVFGVPVGWYPVSALMAAVGWSYAGIIFDINEDPIDQQFRLLISYKTYTYKNGLWTAFESIGWRGTGVSAEVFNYPSNVASGRFAHAEGYSSHAEGNSSHAEGDSSHAEGYSSHAEGLGTIARSFLQHVQGKYNIVDTEGNAMSEGKYAHIVGNGQTFEARSNAHTLDWNGLGWFAGGLKVGGNGQDDETAEEIPTKSQVQTMIDEALGVIENGTY